MNVDFEIPWPPSVNHYYRLVGPRILVSRDGRAYRTRVAAIAASLGRPCLEGGVALKADFWPPDRRRRDLDNIGGKVLLDSLQGAGFFGDDCQVKKIDLAMHEPVDGGRCAIHLENL